MIIRVGSKRLVENSIKNLIDANELVAERVRFSVEAYGVDKLTAVKECRTVQVNPGRQMGKTSFIAKYATYYKAIVIVFDENHANILRDMVSPNNPPTIITIDELKDTNFDAVIDISTFNSVFVDDIERADVGDMRLIYEKFTKDNVYRTFVLFGSRLF